MVWNWPNMNPLVTQTGNRDSLGDWYWLPMARLVTSRQHRKTGAIFLSRWRYSPITMMSPVTAILPLADRGANATNRVILSASTRCSGSNAKIAGL